MSKYEIDKNFITPPSHDPVKELCWTAYETYASYIGRAMPLMRPEDDFEEVMTAYNEERIVVATPGITPELHPWTEFRAAVHTTTMVPINTHQCAFLTNVPYVYDLNDQQQTFTEPNHVGLVITENPDQSDKAEKEGVVDQIIFRTPIPGESAETSEEAAIFEGFEMQEHARITKTETRKLKDVRKLMLVVRDSLRNIVEHELEDHRALYHSQVPVARINHDLNEEFWRSFPPGSPPTI